MSFKPLSLTKNDFFFKAGEINKKVGYLEKGLVRYFVYKDDEESTFEFTKEGEFIADYESFNDKIVSIQIIQAIENCELLTIDYPSVQNIFKTTKNGNFIGRILIEHRFLSQYSDLAQRIPQYLIASYVGVQPDLSVVYGEDLLRRFINPC